MKQTVIFGTIMFGSEISFYICNNSANEIIIEAEIIADQIKEKKQFAWLKPYEAKEIKRDIYISKEKNIYISKEREKKKEVFCLIIKHPHFVYIEKK